MTPPTVAVLRGQRQWIFSCEALEHAGLHSEVKGFYLPAGKHETVYVELDFCMLVSSPTWEWTLQPLETGASNPVCVSDGPGPWHDGAKNSTKLRQ